MTQPFARSYHQYRKGAFRHSTGGISYTPVDWSRIYQFPVGFDGTGQIIGIIELGGGYRQADLDTYFHALGLKSPMVNFVSVGGGQNAPGDPNGADGEVMLDIEVAAGVANGAAINLYMAPNTAQGFVDAVLKAVQDRVDVISISWGGPEDTWDPGTIQAMEQVFVAAAQAGITVTAAAGDNGSSDGEPGTHVDYPSSSPNALACGGTSLSINNGVAVEVVWNDGTNGGATGGGISTLFGLPSWQTASNVPGGAKRGVPDVAGDADPQTGIQVLVDGQAMVIGGTSAVAPLWAGLIAVLNQALGKRVGFLNPLLYTLDPADFNDITQGNNGTYIARAGWDACTGRGTPKGAAILAALQGGVPVPPVPTPTPVPVPTPTPTPTPTPVPALLGKFKLSGPVHSMVPYRVSHGFVPPIGEEFSVDLPKGTYGIVKV